MHGMFYALTNQVDRFSGPGQKISTVATLTAWYQLDLEQKVMTPNAIDDLGPLADRYGVTVNTWNGPQ